MNSFGHVVGIWLLCDDRGGRNHVGPFDQLLALAAFGFARCTFGGVECVPALPGGDLEALVGQELVDVVMRGFCRCDQAACLPVGDEVADGFVGVALGVTD